MHFTQQQGTAIHLPEVESRCEGGLLSLFLHPLQNLDHLSYKFDDVQTKKKILIVAIKDRKSPDRSSQQ